MFPRLNTALSEYLKTSRARTGASVALTIAAAAGVGAASTAAGTQPWTASLNGMARAGHSTAQDSSTNATGKNVFGAVAGTHSAAPAAPAGHAAVKVADAQKADQAAGKKAAPAAPKAVPAAPTKTHTAVGGLLPLPKHPATVQKPADPHRHALVPKKAPAPKPAAPSHPASAPSQPYTIYDSTNPGNIPSGQQQVAVYGNGNFQASFSSVHGRHTVLWIDAKGGNPGCNVLDVEPGDASPSTAADWVKAREAKEPGSTAIVYTMLSEWSAVKSAINALPDGTKEHVRYWIADPTGTPHVVPGSSATQWYWGSKYDLTKALPNFEG